MSKQIHLDAPNIGRPEAGCLKDAIDSGYISTIGPYVPEFEKRFARYLGTKRAVSTQSGTAALHLALHELGIGSGDEVVVPALTFVATVNPIIYVSAKPIFIDVDIRTWNIDPEEVKRHITRRTKAIIPVHLYGNPCAMDRIMDIARREHLYIIEDATESLGAKYNGKPVGTFGDFGCFSFNGNKIITTGGGGMVAGKDMKRLEHIRFLVNQARDKNDSYYHSEIGFNYRMTNIEAALGLAQMERLDGFLEKKRLFNSIYHKGLSCLKQIDFQQEYPDSESSYWFSCIVFREGVDIKVLQAELRKKGIPTRKIFAPIVEFPPYRAYKKGAYKNAYQIHQRGLCLPSSTLNSEEDIYFTCKTIKDLVSR